MRIVLCLCVFLLNVASVTTQGPANTAFYAVSYVELMPSAKAAATAAFKQYRDSSRRDAGFVRIDIFEQIGWPGHFSIIETWSDQKSFDAHAATAHTKEFQAKLQPIRVSGYDQRPYRSLSAGPAPGTAGARSVHIVSHVDIGPAGGSDVVGLLRRLAEESRKENGNMRFDVMQHAMRANHFTVFESWQSLEARDAHAAAAHTKQYRDTVQPMTGSPLDERIYKVVD